MKEELKKEFKKQKRLAVLYSLSLIFTCLFIVVFILTKDKTAIAFAALFVLELYQLIKQVKLCKELKAQLQE